MAHLLSSERHVLAAPAFAPFRAIAAWFGKARVSRTQRLTLANLLELDSHRLADLGIGRQDLYEAMRRAPGSATDYLEKCRLEAAHRS